jgi:tetratricopeptide (TPR) repeat protein
MIVSKNLVSSAVIIGSLAFSGCALNKMVKMAKDQEITVTPSPLEVHADTVKFNMEANLPARMLKKNKTYTINTAYTYGDQRKDLGSVQLKAADYPNARTEQPKASQTFSFPYSEDMRRGDLVVRGVASNVNGKSRETQDMPVAKGIITTSKLARDYYYFAYAEHGYTQAEELQPTYVEFFFPQGSAQLRTTGEAARTNREFDAFIASKNVTRTVSITGSHSPEGAETVNTRLSDNRAQAIEKYYRGRMRRFDYGKKADSIDFVQKTIVLNWTPFKEELEKTTLLTDAQKQEVLSIINSGNDFVQTERQLHRLPYYNRILLGQIYPQLRTAHTEILTVTPKKSDAEISAISQGIVAGNQSADKLNDKELGYAATLTPILSEREKIYTAATKKNDSWESHNNLGAVYLEMAAKEQEKASRNNLLDKAFNQFEISRNKKENAEAYTNMATVYLMRGEANSSAQAAQALDKAQQLNPSEEIKKGINGIRGVIEIKTANYDAAVNSLSNAKDNATVLYNRGLAQLLKKDFERARASFDEAIAADKNLAIAYYGSAIAASRLGNEQRVADMLKQAITLDNSLRARALEDLEFEQYAQSQSFREAVR